ncbi:MAG TPA: hypothetical protein G4O15_07010 [Dehalococcoidia bacterium]|nr:hypothetical protein [Dehalococcoidia bacterium]
MIIVSIITIIPLIITTGCKKTPEDTSEEVLTCPRECICLTEKEATSQDLDLCEGEKTLCGHDAQDNPKYCYIKPVDDPSQPPGGQEPKPGEEPSQPAQAEDSLIDIFKSIDPSKPESLAGLLAASQELDDAVEDGDISEDEAEEAGNELKKKFSDWVRARIDEIDPSEEGALKELFDLQAVQATEEYDKHTDPATKKYKEEQMTEKLSDWVRNRMDEIDPSKADNLKFFFWMQAIQATEKYEQHCDAETQEYKHEQMGEKFNEWVRNRMDEIDPDNADDLKYFFWMQTIQGTEKYEEYTTSDTHNYKEEMMGEKLNEWVRNRVDELDPNDPDFMDNLEKLRLIQYTEKYEKFVTEETHAYKTYHVKQKLGDYITNLVNALLPGTPDFMKKLSDLTDLQQADTYKTYCPPAVKEFKSKTVSTKLTGEPGDGFRVAGSYPESGRSEVTVDQLIIIAFNQPVDPTLVSENISLLPHVETSITLIDENLLVLRPLELLEPDTTYTLVVGPPAVSASGLILEDIYEIQFDTSDSTDIPKVINTLPANGQIDASSGQSIEIQFDQPMIPSAVENALTISPAFDHVIAWSGNESVMLIRPLGPLDANTYYSIGIDSSAVAANGAHLARDYGLKYATGIMSAPSVWGSLPFDGQEGVPSNHPIQIVFDHPMDTASVENALYIFPDVEYTTEWLENNFVLRIKFVDGLTPGIRYSIQVYRSARSAYGIAMGDTSKITFTGLE